MFSDTDTILNNLQSRLHRSGASYTMTDSASTSANSEKTLPIQNRDTIPSITIFQEQNNQPKFTGRPTDNISVYQFIRDAEDTIRKRALTTDEDKINVLRQNIENDDCPARNLLYSTHFLNCKNYSDFKKSLIQSFATTSKLGPISSLFRLAEIFKPSIPSTNIYNALKHSGVTFSSILDQFQDTEWVKDGKMELNKVAVIISYIHFLVMLEPNLFNKIRSDSPLQNNESIFQHAQKYFSSQSTINPIRALGIDKNSAPQASRSRPLLRNNTNNNARSQFPSKNRERSKSPGKSYCKFCKKSGHTLSNCWSVKNNNYCSYHDSTTHNTKDCRARQNRQGSYSQSGENKRSTDTTIK